MAALLVYLLLIVIAVVGFVSKRWVHRRFWSLKDHPKKEEEVEMDDVEIVVQNPVYDYRAHLSLPLLTTVQAHSPIGSMKSSIRKALKELRSRQMVQTLCSKFELRNNLSGDSVQHTAKTAASDDRRQHLLLTASRVHRRDALDASFPAIDLASSATNQTEVAVKTRSNNLNKFLRCYGSNQDNAINTGRCATKKDFEVERTDAEAEFQPLLGRINETLSTDLGLDLQLDFDGFNQYEPTPTADNEEEVSVLQTKKSEPQVVEHFEECDNNCVSNVNLALKLSKDLLLVDCVLDDPISTDSGNNKLEISSDPSAKAALARFKEQVPSNGRRARYITTLKI